MLGIAVNICAHMLAAIEEKLRVRGTETHLIFENTITSIQFPTREEGYLADEQPAVSKVEFAAKDLSQTPAQWEGDGT